TGATATTRCSTPGRWGWPSASCGPSPGRGPRTSWTSREPSTPPPGTAASWRWCSVPARPATRGRVLLDPGASMAPPAPLGAPPHAHPVDRLFSAARQATHFKELRTYYFHNCVYGRVYRTERFLDPLPASTLLADCGPHWKLVVVGDALMAPYELMLRSTGLE